MDANIEDVKVRWVFSMSQEDFAFAMINLIYSLDPLSFSNPALLLSLPLLNADCPTHRLEMMSSVS
jgi:hypothetical protein